MNTLILSLIVLMTSANATNLYVASYSGGSWPGNLTTLTLAQGPQGAYTLSETATLNTSTNSPSWLSYDESHKILYLVDEAINSTGGAKIVAYRTSPSGKLTELNRISTPVGGVSATFYANGGALAVAHYTGALLRTYAIQGDGKLEDLQTFNFSTSEFRSGPVATRQEAPHPHQATLDPSGQFIIVPDLGSDLVHILKVDASTKKLVPQKPLKTPAGYGPRHGAFSLQKTAAGNYVFHLVGELVAQVTAYRADYASGSLSFSELASYTTLNDGQKFPAYTDGAPRVTTAEIALTPDGRTLIISNRNDTTFGTTPPTDSIAPFTVSPSDGTLTKKPLISAHGSFPRHFSLNRKGDLLAVAHQVSGSVVILRRNPATGLFEEKVAGLDLDVGINAPVCVVWDE